MKKTVTYILGALLVYAVMISCAHNQEQPSSLIKMEEFSSSTIALKGSYKEVVARMGMPERTWMSPIRVITADSAYADSCEVLMYPQQGLQYAKRKDSLFLYFVDFNADTLNRLTFRDWVLDNHFTMTDARRCFGGPDLYFNPCYGEDAMCGLDTAGFSLIISDEETAAINDAYDFYFGTDSCLRGMWFPIR